MAHPVDIILKRQVDIILKRQTEHLAPAKANAAKANAAKRGLSPRDFQSQSLYYQAWEAADAKDEAAVAKLTAAKTTANQRVIAEVMNLAKGLSPKNIQLLLEPLHRASLLGNDPSHDIYSLCPPDQHLDQPDILKKHLELLAKYGASWYLDLPPKNLKLPPKNSRDTQSPDDKFEAFNIRSKRGPVYVRLIQGHKVVYTALTHSGMDLVMPESAVRVLRLQARHDSGLLCKPCLDAGREVPLCESTQNDSFLCPNGHVYDIATEDLPDYEIWAMLHANFVAKCARRRRERCERRERKRRKRKSRERRERRKRLDARPSNKPRRRNAKAMTWSTRSCDRMTRAISAARRTVPRWTCGV